MNLLLDEIFSTIIQLLMFLLIPLLWWFFTSRKKINFFEWIGLKKVMIVCKSDKIKYYLLLSVCFLVYSIFGFLILYIIRNVDTATSKFSGLGFFGIPAALVYAILKTSLSEEILFRGFLLKRISNKFGFKIGNIIQGFLFGFMHVLLFINIGIVEIIIIGIFTGSLGWFIGYVNEKKANGSIIPGWIIHALANIFSSFLSLFSVI